MNNCRAGLYGFASTATWLQETGTASPPHLVMLGLTLPDSRILSGIAGIGLTLANIAFILPHLRQPILDGMHAHEAALAHEQSTQGQMDLSDGFNPTRPVDLSVETPSLALVPPCDREHQTLPLSRSATIKSLCSAVTEPLDSLVVGSEVSLHTILLLSPGKTDDGQIPLQIYRSPDPDASEKHASFGCLLAREGQGPIYIPLPVPDAVEVTFFDTVNVDVSDCDLGEDCPLAACEKHTIPKKHSAIEINGQVVGKGTFGQLATVDLPSTPARVEIREDFTDIVVPPPTKAIVQDYRGSLAEGTVSHLSDSLAVRGGTAQSAKAGRSRIREKEVRRPESLEFIPQSVVRRYPSVPMAFAGRCFGHRAFGSGPDHQAPLSPHILVHDPAMLLEGTWPRASHTPSEGSWRASFLTEVHTKRRPVEDQTFIEMALAQDPLQQGQASLPEPPTVHEPTPPREYPTQRRRLGVLARAALRNRRSTAHRYKHNAIDGSSTSDSDSELDSNSQYSSGSSADASMLPHMLGADLIAAIDANSESGLDLSGPRRITCTPLEGCGDILISEDSAADVSMVMHVSSSDDTSDSEVGAPGTFRPLTYEDIQLWASGVVQKCVRRVCRSRTSVEPSSPSQASDICAERPSSSGISQCPLSGLHCKVGGAAPASVPPASTLPNRKPLSVRNLRDVPEFVPRQRHVSVMTQRMGCPRRFGTRSTIDVTRDAATEVIARMESRAGFNAQQQFVVSMAGGWHGT